MLGGGREVGRSAMVLSDSKYRIMLDYGMAVGDPPQWPMPAPKLDAVILSHSHMDHCLHPESYVQLDNGEIRKIRDVVSGSSVPAIDFEHDMRTDSIPCIQRGKIRHKGKMLEISTRSHRLMVTADHQFFVLNGLDCIAKKASELKRGDFLAMIKKLNISGEKQCLPKAKGFPKETDERLMQLLGYMCGDGDFQRNTLRCTDKNVKNLGYYSRLVEQIFPLKSHIHTGSRNKMSVFSVKLMAWLKEIVPEILTRSRQRTIPSLISRATTREVAAFLRGLWDAEGSVKHHSVVLCSSSKDLLQQVQLLLLRFGVSCQIYTMDQSKSTFGGGPAYQLAISNPESLKLFGKEVCFSDSAKSAKLKTMLPRVGRDSAEKTDLIPLDGKTIIEIGRRLGLGKMDLVKLGINYGHYLQGHRPSREAVKNMVAKLLNLAKQRDRQTYQNLLHLNDITESHVGWEPIKSIEEKESDAEFVYDLTVPGHSNYIANGMVVHNCGAIPVLYNKTQRLPFFTNDISLSATMMLIKDSVKIARWEGYDLPFSQQAVQTMIRNARLVDYGDKFKIGDFRCELRDAGHIPGSASPLLEHKSGMRIFYTGDIKLEDTKLLQGADIPNHTDVLIIDSTYSQTEHPSRVEEEKHVIEAVEEALALNQPVILPVFAVGRSQEALLILEKYADKIAIDGMARDATQMAMSYGRYLRDPAALKRILNKVTWIRTEADRAAALKKFPIIVTTAGMASGGPIIYYLRHLRGSTEAKVLFIGYLTEDSPARGLLETGILRTAEEEIKVRCDMRHYDLSAHAGRSELFEIVRRTKPSFVICVHGEPQSCDRFAEEIEEQFRIKAVSPSNGEVVEIEV